jgi:uncharacterized protein (DUF362 family)
MKEFDIVSVFKIKKINYPSSPFNPRIIHKEFSNFRLYKLEKSSDNDVYDGVRESLFQLGLDKVNYNTKKWNPFKDLVKSGQVVVIKPNLVFERNPIGVAGVLCTISHASIVRPIIDYLLLATGGDVEIIICDVPLQQAVWNDLVKFSGFKNLVNYYKEKKINIQLIDLRLDIATTSKEGLIVNRVRKTRDPLGYLSVNLGKRSSLMPIIKNYRKFEITDYNSGTVSSHHNPNKNEYLIAKTVLNCDLLINVPKLKTHRKSGITFALKNLIGINGDKSWIAHHRRGSLVVGGDEYPKFIFKNLLKYIWTKIKKYHLKRLATLILFFYKKISSQDKFFLKKTFAGRYFRGITEGSWYGNDTIWRCIIDINNILFFADKKGFIKNKEQRKYLCIGDGIISGEGDGPTKNTPKKTGLIISGFNPLAIDRVSSEIMGFDHEKIKLIKEGARFLFLKTKKIKIIKNKKNIEFKFKPPVYWDFIKK